MSFLTENWFFLGVALACIGMHLFGHGGHGRHGGEHGGRRDDERQRTGHGH